MSNELQFFILAPATGVVGFVLSVLWGRISRPESFDRDTIVFLGKMWLGLVVFFLVIYFILQYNLI